MKKRFFLLTIVIALLGIGQAWANEVTKSNADLVACLDNGKVKISESHVTFYLVSVDNGNIVQESGYDYIQLGNKLGGGVTKNFELNWEVKDGYEIAVSKVSMGTWCYGAYKATFTIGSGTAAQVNSGAASLLTPTFVEAKDDNISSTATKVSMQAWRNSGIIAGNQEFVANRITITYTVTPKAVPALVDASEATINVTLNSSELDVNAPQTVNLASYFTSDSHLTTAWDFDVTPNSNYEISNNVFHALVAGDYVIKARTAAVANCHEASAWSGDALTITVNRLDQTLSWVDEVAINTNMVVDAEQKIAAVSTSGRAVSYTSGNTDVLTVDAEGNLKAVAVGEATITVSRAQDDQYNAAESISKTFKVRLKDTPFFKPVDFASADSCAVPVNEEAAIELSYVSDGLEGDFTATPANGSVISVSREGNMLTIHPLKVGKTTLTLSQTENASLYGLTKTYTINVIQIVNTIKVNGELNYSATINPSKSIAIVLSSNNTELDPATIVAEQIEGENVAVLKDGVIYANYREGTATWKVTQAESENYFQGETTFSVTVQKAEANTAYVLDDPELQEWGTVNRTKEYPVSGPADKLIFQAKRTTIWGFSSNSNFFAEYSEKESGDEWNRLEPYMDLPETDKWYDFEYTIPEGTKRVRMRTETGATGNRHIQNVKVTRKTYVRAEEVALELFPQEAGEGVLKVDYSVANGGDLQIVCDNDKFTLDSYSVADVDGKVGSVDIPVHFAAQETEGTEEAHIIIYNGVYNTAVTVTAKVRKITPVITFENVEMTYAGDPVTVAATADQEVAVLYEVTEGTDVVEYVDGKLFALKAGSAKVKAYTEGTTKYNAAEKVVEVTVDKATPEVITAPQAGDIKLGESLNKSELYYGEASVEGSFAWEDGSLVPESVGAQKYNVVFTPDDANYKEVVVEVDVTVTENATGCEEIEAGVKAVKIIRDGQVLIMRGGKVYTTSGLLVK